MYTTTDLLNQYFDKINEESTTAGKVRALRGFNQKQRMIVNKKPFWWAKKHFLITTEVNKQAYDLNPLIQKIESVAFTQDETTYPVIEISDPDDWTRYNGLTGNNVTSDIPTYYHLDGQSGQILIFPKSSVAGNTIDILARSRARKLILEDTSTGTVSVTNGSKTVTGSGTSWAGVANLRAGAHILIGIDEVPYEIASIDSNTQITLVKKFFGTTASSQTYRIGDVPLIHEDYQDVLWALEAFEYLGLKKGNSKMYAELKDYLYNDVYGIWTLLMADTLSETSANVIQKRKVGYGINPNEYPQDLTD